MLPLPGTPSSSYPLFRQRLSAMFDGVDKRVVASFWLFGLINNVLYVIILSSALDLVGPAVPKSLVLLFDVVPSFLVKLTAPYYIHLIPYNLRILAFVILSSCGMLLVALSPSSADPNQDNASITVKMLGVILASISSGGGELSFLGLTHFYGPFSLAAWGSGTGGAGLVGSGAYLLATTALGLSVRTSLLAFSFLPVIMLFSFFVLLPAQPKSHEYTPAAQDDLDPDTESLLNDAVDHAHPPSSPKLSQRRQSIDTWHSLKVRFSRARSLFLPYMLPLLLVYVAEYTINQGVAPTLLFPLDQTPFEHYRSFYPTYNAIYQLGVFISRSSLPFVRIHALYLPSFLQCLNLAVLATHAMFPFLPNVWFVFAITFWEGLLGGIVYVSTFRRIGEEVAESDREFSLGATSVSDSGGICIAGFLGMAVETVRAYVQWKDSSVFAGEEIECIISFTNTCDDGDHQAPDDHPTRAKNRQRTVTHSTQQLSTVPSIAPSVAGSRAPSHRPTLSLSVYPPPSSAHQRVPSHAASNATAPNTRHAPTHGRSLSIISMGSDKAAMTSPMSPRRPPARGHGRSASMQLLSRTPSYQAPSLSFSSYRNPSPLQEHHPPLTRRTSGIRTAPGTPAFNFPSPTTAQPPHPANTSPQRPPSTSHMMPPPRHPSASSASFPPPNFSFAPESPGASRRGSPALDRSPMPEFQFPIRSPAPPQRPHHLPSPKLPDAPSYANPLSRIISESGANDTPRTSSDFYSLTNHSSETVSSDAALPPTSRILPKPINGRNQKLPPTSMPRNKDPETLMMGYVQTMGSFVLDGSLVNQTPFEDVKRKGVVGGQGGGGVVGVEKSKRESGMFGFGWGNIGESLGGLLGGGEMSSIKEMRSVASSKTIPLLSTPQSILFVDLRLAPGETKSYSYRFRLPRGLPPSHKGRAIKVQYQLTLGIQRPGGKQQVKHIEIPFRVLGSVNTHPESGSGALLSPTAEKPSRRRSSLEDVTPNNMKEAIDMAILRSNISSGSSDQLTQSNNRFTIARGGQLVAIITIVRPAYRLGETITGIIEFSPPASETESDTEQIPSYGINVWLETTERVDPSLALRSSSSVQRATRKIHAHVSENVLFARKVSFRLEIPTTATPTFKTTGVQLDWRVRVEFVTARVRPKAARGLGIEDDEVGVGGSEEELALAEAKDNGLLEEVGRDERGVVKIAKERLVAETFEVAVPVRVYGVTGTELERQEAETDGLEV
ncbi:Rgp1-domain-containing protein [Aureobasidium sp. EXF-10728]|nr:Rgp1-domain-containing protein [Aureobasidium sp. EXF-10728]